MKYVGNLITLCALTGVASADVIMDQIGPDDGSNIGANITGCQDFEASFDIYDIATLDNFTGAGETINMVEMVLNGWNGFIDPSSVTGYTANLHSDPAAAALDLIGDIGSSYVDAADATISATWAGAGYVVSMPTDMTAAAGTNWVSMVPSNPFATGGQTGTADSLTGDGVLGWQANPGGGFGMPGNMQIMAGEAAYRVHSGAPADPCDSPLPTTCAADVNADGFVNVTDVLAIIGQWGDCGDGTFRPSGDIAPMPNGDCCVNVGDVLAVVGSWGADCTIYGACCYPDESCADLSDADCTANGGSWNGAGSDCSGTDCLLNNSNDECADASAVYDGPNAFDISDMTPSAGDPSEALCPILGWVGFEVRDGWYSYVATGGETIFTTCDSSSFDTSMVLYEDDCTTQVACSGDATGATGCQLYYSEFTYDCVEGATYIIRMGGWQGAFGAGTLNITPLGPPVAGACCFPDESCLDNLLSPDCASFGGSFAGENTECKTGICDAGAGDECADAIPAYEGPNAFDTSLMTASTPEPDEAMCEGTFLDWTSSPDMWMAWVATGDGTASFSACDATSYDTSMVLYEGTCENQVACNGDTSGETGCQTYYSAIYDYPVTAGTTYYVRMGGWQAATGAGTVTITFISSDTDGACCMPDGSCADATSVQCAGLGGTWDGSALCAATQCPQPWAGCPAGSLPDCDACWVDGQDSATDCNGGLNAPVPVYQDYNLGDSICGTCSVFVDGPTGLTYRDLDWYVSDVINAGGTFNMTFGTSGMGAFCLIYDPVTFDQWGVEIAEGGGVNYATLTVPAGDYVVLVGPDDWNAAWICGSGLNDYYFTIE